MGCCIVNSWNTVIIEWTELMKRKCGLPHYVCMQKKKKGRNKQGSGLGFFKFKSMITKIRLRSNENTFKYGDRKRGSYMPDYNELCRLPEKKIISLTQKSKQVLLTLTMK